MIPFKDFFRYTRWQVREKRSKGVQAQIKEEYHGLSILGPIRNYMTTLVWAWIGMAVARKLWGGVYSGG